MAKSISILGCGWLGFPLAKCLVKSGWQVKGSTTELKKMKELKAAGIDPFMIKLGENPSLCSADIFLDSEYLIVNVPPSKGMKTKEDIEQLINLIKLSTVKKVIFVSSTSVYPNVNGEIEEEYTDQLADDTHHLIAAERQFQKTSEFETTIVRFGGLFGGERHPGGFFKSARITKNPESRVNLIHLDDCITLLTKILEREVWGEVLNGVTDTHPTKREFYSLSAKVAGFPVPDFEDVKQSPFKIVSNKKVKELLGMEFEHSDLMREFE